MVALLRPAKHTIALLALSLLAFAESFAGVVARKHKLALRGSDDENEQGGFERDAFIARDEDGDEPQDAGAPDVDASDQAQPAPPATASSRIKNPLVILRNSINTLQILKLYIKL